MAKIHINNPKQVINGGAKKYYFKVKGLGGPKGDKGDTGATGPQGPQGPQGNAATVSVGSTTTLPVGYDATVTNTGSIYNAVLNFGIPQGPRGPQGATGATGAKGDKGDQGNPGPQGEKGTNATVYVGTTSTLNPGSQATVYNSGTDSNAVLNFGIPKGEKGDTGPMPTIAQSTGQATDQVMSQKATTDALNTKQDTISSSNKLSADLVTDTSTTNKFVTAEDKTTWNAKQDALTAGTGIDITSGIISTPAIVPEVVTELPTTGAEGKLYLTPKAHTTQTATGNPIEATVTEQAGQMESFQLDGDTYQQTYTGQNLYNVALVTTGNYVTKDDDGWITITRDNTSGDSAVYTNVWTNNLALETSTPYKIFIEVKAVSGTGSLFITSTNSTQGQFNSWQEKTLASMTAGQTYTVTPTTKDSFSGISNGLRTVLQQTVGQGGSVTFRLSVCAYSTPTDTFSYEPYTGGQASPSPSYPQDINVVTGTQTISINGTDYPISLGSLELCKLGTYQDYIYKDGSDWKVHKNISSTRLTSSYDWFTDHVSDQNRLYINSENLAGAGVRPSSNMQIGQILSTHFSPISVTNLLAGDGGIGISQTGFISIRDNEQTTANGFKDWLDNNNIYVYYALATATDTTITDQTLISQLEAIRTALLQNGANTITNTATGSNLAGDMEIGYYGFVPRNRYDKWLWLDINNEYEQIGS